jgi:signal transduction histidine kinase
MISPASTPEQAGPLPACTQAQFPEAPRPELLCPEALCSQAQGPQALLDELHPFHFVVNRESRIVSQGSVLTRLFPALKDHPLLEEVFCVRKPELDATYEVLAQHTRTVLLLAGTTNPLQLRGQLVPLAHGDLLFVGSPWVAESGELARHGLSFEDFALHDPAFDFMLLIHGQRTAMADLRRLNSILQKRRVELAAAKQSAEVSNRAKSAFLSTVSHELFTPLNSIIGYTEILLEESDLSQEEMHQDLQRIHSSARNLLQMVRDLIDFSKLETGDVDLYPEIFEVRQLIEEVVGQIAGNTKSSALQTEIQCDPVLSAYTDRLRLRSIIARLVSNAYKFTEKGSIRVAARSAIEGDRQWLVMEVADSGIGIASNHLEKLFLPFSQVEAVDTRKYGGMGLGLALVRQMSAQIGAQISVESELGKGTMFTLRVPSPPAGT